MAITSSKTGADVNTSLIGRTCLAAILALLFLQRQQLHTCDALSSTASSSASSPYAHKIAVVLNVNARSVTPASVVITEDIVGKENVFVTTSVEDNDLAARTIVDRGYGTIVPAGGDGTLCSVINSIVSVRREKKIQQQLQSKNDDSNSYGQGKLPRFAFLPLGTGNGMGMLVGPRIGGKKKRVSKMLT